MGEKLLAQEWVFWMENIYTGSTFRFTSQVKNARAAFQVAAGGGKVTKRGGWFYCGDWKMAVR